jgi:phosphoribosyl-ATP pyrophosphohydrolase/phosphoribosyl-AMP cyclohydrolase/histidinol dehydrogenase
VQAIATMAYGVGGVDACDIIVGPGNKWVTAAKSLISGVCAIGTFSHPHPPLFMTLYESAA